MRSLARIQMLISNKNEFDFDNRSNKIDYFILNDPALAESWRLDGVILSDVEQDISVIRTAYPNLLVGGIAGNIADCKNWELNGVDFIQFRFDLKGDRGKLILGSESLSNIIPKKTEYGWMIMSLNVPVFVKGAKTLSELKDLYGEIDYYGVVLSSSFEPNCPLIERIEKIENFFG